MIIEKYCIGLLTPDPGYRHQIVTINMAWDQELINRHNISLLLLRFYFVN